MGSLSSEGLEILGEKDQLTCQRPNTESRCQHAVEGGVPATGTGTNPKGKQGREHREIAACLDLCLHQREAGSYPSPSTSPGAQPALR